ncbi:MAG: RNA pyrophosphohydrolase [archaeon ADurb.Bin336]|nr:MAG: RNA pyrophosphohydrolase [archaeon ADurb.Bin336]
MYPENNFSKKSVQKKSSSTRSVVGIIAFDGEKFLLLHRVLNWSGWEFAKGGIEKGENIESAIKRELFEETGIPRFELISKIDEYKFLNKLTGVMVHVQNYLVRVSSNNKITFENQPLVDGKVVYEHDDYKWCFPKEAVKLITHNNSRRSLKKAIKLLGLSMEK